MDIPRRFVFLGSASALGGQIYYPKTVILDVDGAASLGVAGGRSHAEIAGRSFGEFVRFTSGLTFAEGLYDDEKRARQVFGSGGRLRVDELSTTTTVMSALRGLSVGMKGHPVLDVKHLRATLKSHSPEPGGSGEPRIYPDDDTTIQGVSISGHRLIIRLDVSLFQTLDTRSKLAAALDNPKFVRARGGCFPGVAAREGARLPSGRPVLVGRDLVYATIVRSIRWAGKPFPGAKIDRNRVIVPDFGQVFFGELFITTAARRLTMVRFELGSPLAGSGDGGGSETNGGWFP
jgi:hypothetical protein